MNLKFNRSDFILLSVIYLINIFVKVYDYTIAKNSLLEFLVNIPFSIITSFMLIYIFVFTLIPRYIIKQKRYITFVIIGLLLIVLVGGINYLVGFWSGNRDWNEFPKWFNYILYSVNLGAGTVLSPLGLLLIKKVYEEQVLLAKQKEKQKENELKLLRSQIDPHFLFNNLNTLDALIDNNPKKAKEYINRLSLIYRYLIRTKDAEVMELSEEMDFARNYIFLIETRFGRDYDFELKESVSLKDKFIPTGAIQALLENVVKHNKKHNNTPIKTTIEINDQSLIITNTRSKIKSNQESFGTGLENLKTRYKLLSDKEVQIAKTENEFEISLPIIILSK